MIGDTILQYKVAEKPACRQAGLGKGEPVRRSLTIIIKGIL